MIAMDVVMMPHDSLTSHIVKGYCIGLLVI